MYRAGPITDEGSDTPLPIPLDKSGFGRRPHSRRRKVSRGSGGTVLAMALYGEILNFQIFPE